MDLKITTSDQQTNRRHLTVWRRHFYFGLLVASFLTLLAVTGLGVLLFVSIIGKEGERIYVTPQVQVQPLSAQTEVARQSVNPEAVSVVQYIAPCADDMVAAFHVNNDDKMTIVAVDPYATKIVSSMPYNKGWYHAMGEIHGDMVPGTAGDYLTETTASLIILMMITGTYLWWAKQHGLKPVLVSQTGRECARWRSIHDVFGTWVFLALLLFCLSGVAWVGVWGDKFVQSRSQFPTGKWGIESDPVSVVSTYGDVLNDGKTEEVPWILGLTPMPVSGTTKSKNGINPSKPMTSEMIDRFAREIGFRGRYQFNLPKGETGVWTLSWNSMSHDMVSPAADCMVHIGQYSGKILANIHFDGYNFSGKLMTAGIALRMGTLGWWSMLASILSCLAVIFIYVSGCAMWWKRRPSKVDGPVPPTQKIEPPIWWVVTVPLLIVTTLFPTTVATITVIWPLGTALLPRILVLEKRFKQK